MPYLRHVLLTRGGLGLDADEDEYEELFAQLSSGWSRSDGSMTLYRAAARLGCAAVEARWRHLIGSSRRVTDGRTREVLESVNPLL